jgi:peroxiredoxin
MNRYFIASGLLRCILITATLLLAAAQGMAANLRPEMALQVGDRAPSFSVATSQDTLADYNRDYYGQHHLVLSFFPAAFTPV